MLPASDLVCWDSLAAWRDQSVDPCLSLSFVDIVLISRAHNAYLQRLLE